MTGRTGGGSLALYIQGTTAVYPIHISAIVMQGDIWSLIHTLTTALFLCRSICGLSSSGKWVETTLR